MVKEISVKEFVAEYNKQTSDALKDLYIKNHLKVEEYVGYNCKIVLADKIVKNSTYATEPVIENGQIGKDENGNIKYQQTNRIQVNSCMRYILFVFTVIQTYTNIIMDNTKMLEEYDLLNKENLIEKIFEMIPKKEIEEMNQVVKMTFDDLMTNSYESHAFISNQVQRITDVLGAVLKPLVDKFAAMPDEEIEKFGDKIIKFMDKKVK